MKINIPKHLENVQNTSILNTNENIKEQLGEILEIQSEVINQSNIKKVEEVLSKCSLLLSECHELDTFKPTINNDFQRLTYEYQTLKNKYENYMLDDKLQCVDIKIKVLEKKQEKLNTENNNLVYNILGFMASFSIVSAAVTAIVNIKSTIDIIIYMTFLSFILILTLIALNNFYKNRNYFKTKLQNNYFICKILLVFLIIFMICRGAIFIKENLNIIFEAIGRGIGQVMQINNKE